MPSRRELIAMSEAEVHDFLANQSRIILVTNGPRGFPHPVPMNFGLDGEGRILMLAFAKGQKVLNLERDPRATLLVETGSHYAELKAMMIEARAEVIHDRAEFARCRAAFTGKVQTRAGDSPERQAQIDASMAKRVALRFTPERVVSWDHAKLSGKY